MWACLLFALVISTNCWGTVVTAEWGDYVSPARTFPKEANTYDEIEGIRITRSSTLTSGYVYVGGRDSYNNYQLNDVGEYVEITLSSGTISSVQFCVWTANENLLKIRFCKESEYSDDPEDLAGEAYYVMHDAVQAGSGLQTINAPANAKSAHIYKDGAANWQCYLYRLIITASDDCASPQKATFAAGGSGNPTGSTPDDIERCEGSTFTLPNASSLTWGGYLFAGWNDGSNTYAAGASYTMPAGGVSFTAQWEVDNTTIRIPTTSTLTYANKTGGSSDTRDFYDETCVDLYTTHYVEWNAYITPGNYQISMKYGSPYYGIRGTFSIVDPLGIESPRVFYTQVDETNGAKPIYKNPSVTYDLTGLTANKLYTIKVEHNWGGSSLSIAHIEFTPLGGDHNITFAKGDENVTGNLPANTTAAEGGTYTLPSKGNLALTGNTFTGWSDGSNTYAAGSSYTMPNHDVTFTAQWESFTVPVVSMPADSVKVHGTDFEVSWVIPGICDLKKPVKATMSGVNSNTQDNPVYNPLDSTVTAVGSAGNCNQYGVAFNIPEETDVTSVTVDWRINSGTLGLFAAIINSSNGYTYWEHNQYFYTENTWNKASYTIGSKYWTDGGGGYSRPTSVQYVGAFANDPGNGGFTNESFSVRELRYHVAGRPDIDHVVLMRTKANSDPALTDTIESSVTKRVYSGIKSYYYDEDEKEEGTTYYYTIFAVHADGTLSSGTVVGKSTAEAEKFAVTYDVNGALGDDVPASASYTAGRTFTLPLQGDLHKSGHKFGGWNDGSTTTAAGASYTMPDPGAPVSFTAVWNEFSVPVVTDLAVGEAVDKEVPLSYIIPGLCDLSNPVAPKYQNNVDPDKVTYNPNMEDNYVTANGNAGPDDQYGVAFAIPATANIEWLSFEYRGVVASNVNLWGGLCDAEDNANAYWQMQNPMTIHPNDAVNWASSGELRPNIGYWNSNPSSLANPLTQSISQVAVYANASGEKVTGISFDVRNVRYHIAGQEDIDHVVIVRKDGADPENPTDGTVLYNGTKSFYVDEDDSKEFGHTYHYAVFAVHADGTVSNPTITTHTVVATATCEVSFNIGEGAIGDAPTSVDKPANGTVTLPSIGTVYKPFYAFTGWKKNNAGDLLAAGSTYTVTAEDVTAETISFTAQWQEDNTTIRIPDTKTFGVSNKPANINTISDVDFNNDGNGDAALDIQNTAAEWSVFIQPGYYEVSMLSAVWRYGMKYTLSLIDPLTDTPVKTFFTKNISRNENQTQYLNDTVGTFDLTDLIKGKRYVLKIEDTWTGCYLRVHDINFNPVTPEEIASEVVLDAGNTVTTGLTEVTDVDFPGDNDQSVKLYNQKMDWVVKIAKGYYNISLLYGATAYSTRVSVALIDPEGVEPTRWFCPDQADRNGHYHYTAGTQGTQYYSIGLVKRDLYDIDPEKTYIVRVHDEYNGSNELRVKNLTFSPVTPEVISNVTDTRLDATNTIAPPTMVTDLDIDDDNTLDELMNLKNTNAEWLVTLQKGLYNVQLVYGAPKYDIKVSVVLIDPTNEESERLLSVQGIYDYYNKPNPATGEAVQTTPHHYTSATKCVLLDVSEDKTYKVRVADAYPDCYLRVSHVLFTPIAPLQIPNNETRLDASNVFVAPAMNGDRIDISNRKEAVWYAKITPGIYDFSLNYYAEAGGTKVRYGIVDAVTGDTIFRDQQNKYDAAHTTYTINSSAQDLQTALDADKVYKIFVKDNYAYNGSVPQINYLEIVHHAEIHTRTGLTVGKYGTICLPYAVAAVDRNGADLFEIDEWDPNGASLTLSQLGDNEDMVAGRPYIFQATAATATFRYYAEGDEAAAGSNNGLVGSYEQALIPQNDDNYIIYNNKLYLVNSEAYVGAYRAYIHKEDQVQPAPSYRRRVTLSVNGAQVITDIDQINDPAQMTKYIENGHLFILRDGKLYNAQGQLVK